MIIIIIIDYNHYSPINNYNHYSYVKLPEGIMKYPKVSYS